ncbi:MAG: hypothetical protein AB1716_11960 [Planctomycetota bacterium]
MNGDRVVDGLDVDPFVQALIDPAGYALTYPGLGAVPNPLPPPPTLEGSRAWHGDCNCSGEFTVDDWAGFYTMMGKCEHECATGEDAPGVPPEQTAQTLRTSVARERQPVLLNVLAHTAANARSRAVRDYWQAVYEHLTR